MTRWEVERNSAKCDRRKPRWTKLKMPTMGKPIPKLKITDFEEGSEGMGKWRGMKNKADGEKYYEKMRVRRASLPRHLTYPQMSYPSFDSLRRMKNTSPKTLMDARQMMLCFANETAN